MASRCTADDDFVQALTCSVSPLALTFSRIRCRSKRSGKVSSDCYKTSPLGQGSLKFSEYGCASEGFVRARYAVVRTVLSQPSSRRSKVR